MSKAYKLGSAEMTEAMIKELPLLFPMELVRDDMTVLIKAPVIAWGSKAADDEAQRMISIYSGIAEALGIEGV